MKKIAFVAALLASTSMGAMAQAYVAADIGWAHINVDTTGATNSKTSSTGYKLTAGYGFGNGFAVEGGWIDFGKATADVTTAGAAASMELKSSGLFVAGAYRAQVAKDWGVSGRLGVADLKTKGSATVSVTGVGSASASDSETHAAALIGLGADYAITPQLKAQLSADFSKSKFGGDSGNVRLISLGMRYNF